MAIHLNHAEQGAFFARLRGWRGGATHARGVPSGCGPSSERREACHGEGAPKGWLEGEDLARLHDLTEAGKMDIDISPAGNRPADGDAFAAAAQEHPFHRIIA